MKLYCKCGAAWSGQCADANIERALEATFRHMHREPGCGPATAAQARAARHRTETAATREKLKGEEPS